MKKYAPLFIVFAACLWGTMGIFVRHLNSIGLTSMQVVEVRGIVAAIILSIGIFIYNKSLFKLKMKDIWCFLGTGIISVTLFGFCYFKTIDMMSLSVAATLLYTCPIFVMILSMIFFKEQLTLKKIAAIILAFSGCVLVSGVLSNNTPFSALGILIGVCSGLCYASYSIFSRFAILKGYHSLTITVYTFLFAALGGACITGLEGSVKVVEGGIGVISYVVMYTLITTIFPYIFYTLGLNYMENSKAAIIAAAEPVTATLVGLLVFREVPTVLMILGMFLVLGAILVLNIKTASTNIHEAKESA